MNVYTVEYREKRYPSRPKANKIRASTKKKDVHDPGGVGEEIVREIALCPACAGAIEEHLAEQIDEAA